MKVVQINMTLKKGSTGKIVNDIHEELIKNNIESYTFYTYWNVDNVNSFKVETDLEKFIKRVLVKLIGKYDLFSIIPTIRLINKIKKINPDIIHVHNIHHQTFSFEKLFSFLSKYNKPVVLTLHDCWFFTGGCYYFTSINCSKYKTECCECTKLKSELDCPIKKVKSNYLIKKNILNDFNNLNIVTVSNWLNSVVKESFLSNRPIRTIHNGIDTNIFNSIEKKTFHEHKNTNKFLILGVANYWTDRKGLKKFVELADAIDENYHILLVGEYDKNITHKRITFIGKTKGIEELVNIYKYADVFINLSLEETFGLVSAEAMACGTPIITLNSTANPELISNKCGHVVEVNSIEEIFNKIILIKENGKNHYSKSCIDNIKQNYTKNLMCEKYLALYNELNDSQRK